MAKRSIEDLEEITHTTNRYFVYEGDILRAAQPKLSTALRYMKKDRTLLWGTPKRHVNDLTQCALNLLNLS